MFHVVSQQEVYSRTYSIIPLSRCFPDCLIFCFSVFRVNARLQGLHWKNPVTVDAPFVKEPYLCQGMSNQIILQTYLRKSTLSWLLEVPLLFWVQVRLLILQSNDNSQTTGTYLWDNKRPDSCWCLVNSCHAQFTIFVNVRWQPMYDWREPKTNMYRIGQ